MTEQEKQTNREFYKKILSDFEELKQRNIRMLDTSNNKIYFTKGLVFGLIYGIIGNLFVQFFYPVIQSLVLQTLDLMFLVNVIVSVITVAFIIFVTYRFKRQLEPYEKVRNNSEFLLRHIGEIQKGIKEEFDKLKQ